MSDNSTRSSVSSQSPPNENSQPAKSSSAAERREARRWWIKLLVQPLLLLAVGVALIAGLGVAQRLGWVSARGGSADSVAASGDTRMYICPMLCTPPQIGPGRCPVCEMELVPAASGGGPSDSKSVRVDPVARRVANIRTVAVSSTTLARTIQTVGELHYDEGSLKTISSYVDGRLERLFADFTGVVVEKGDPLALVYSPRLYSGQTELLLSKKYRDAGKSARLAGVTEKNREMYESSQQRLIELGMTREQIQQLERVGEANSRMQLLAPLSGTVIKKYANEGQYVKEGDPIYELADLSTVWLMLELFPEDVGAIRYGQKVAAQVQSLPGRTFVGRVAFVDPVIDPDKHTVGVRVVVPNQDGFLRVGDYARATVHVPLARDGSPSPIYDPELANKWISPRHPQVVQSSPGKCHVCGIDLVPASQFGFTGEPVSDDGVLTVPRNAVLRAGPDSVIYVETDPGRFEIRNVVLGARSGDQVVVLKGVDEGENVAVSGNFLIDSQMQLAGNPSLIDPTKAPPILKIELDEDNLPSIGVPEMVVESFDRLPQLKRLGPDEDEDGLKQLESQLSPEDRQIVERQKLCPVAGTLLGSMGLPIKVMVEGRPVFICCERCRERLLGDPAKYLTKPEQSVEP